MFKKLLRIFIQGMGSVIDLSPTVYITKNKKSIWESIGDDFRKVGGYINKAINDYDKEKNNENF